MYYMFFQIGKRQWKSSKHKAALDDEVKIQQNFGNILEKTNKQANKTMKNNRVCLMKVIDNLPYFCRQGHSIQGDSDKKSNFHQLLKLRWKNDPVIIEWIEKESGDKYTSHDIQNKLIKFMAHQLLRDLVEDIGSKHFSLIADEYTDISNKEQLTICIRWIDEYLDTHEDVIGFYNIPNISSTIIFLAIKDAIIQLQRAVLRWRQQYGRKWEWVCQTNFGDSTKGKPNPLPWSFSKLRC